MKMILYHYFYIIVLAGRLENEKVSVTVSGFSVWHHCGWL